MSTGIEGIGMTSQRTRERLINRLCEQGIVNINVLEVMRTMPRHIFLDEALSHRAYEDTSLPIGYKQTLSQPYIVAKMTELILSGNKINKVLEIGTGSGYQCAVLSQLVKKVYSVERIEPLLIQATKRFQDLKLSTNYCCASPTPSIILGKDMSVITTDLFSKYCLQSLIFLNLVCTTVSWAFVP